MALARITDRQTTDSLIAKLRRAFRSAGHREAGTVVGYPGGNQAIDEFYVVDSAGIWLGYKLSHNRHWCSFGLLPLPEHHNVPITVEINPPLEGVDRRIRGLFAADDQGNAFLCHTGGVGGGRPGIGQGAFLEWFGREREPVADPDGRQSFAFPVAEVGSQRMISQIAEYVRCVADFKAGRPAPVPSASQSPFNGNAAEFEGTRAVPAQPARTATCDHGTIRNRLADLIRAAGHDVARDQARDLIVGDPNTPDIEFEIKTAANPQSIYSAVGQLLVHGVTAPAVRKVAVLPAPVAESTSHALSELDIDLVTYTWTDTHIQYNDLDHFVEGADNRAPINSQN